MSPRKQINIKNGTYYFFNDINIKNFDSNLIKTDKESYKNIDICLHWMHFNEISWLSKYW